MTKQQARGIPGRVFVLPFIVMLVVVVILMLSVAIRFQTIMAHLEEVRSLWPSASQKLKGRYERLAAELENSQASDEVKAEFQRLLREFQATSQFDRQSVASAQIEQTIVPKLASSKADTLKTEQAEIEKVMDADQRRKNVQSDLLGRLTVQGLRLKLPPIFEPNVSLP